MWKGPKTWQGKALEWGLCLILVAFLAALGGRVGLSETDHTLKLLSPILVGVFTAASYGILTTARGLTRDIEKIEDEVTLILRPWEMEEEQKFFDPSTPDRWEAKQRKLAIAQVSLLSSKTSLVQMLSLVLLWLIPHSWSSIRLVAATLVIITSVLLILVQVLRKKTTKRRESKLTSMAQLGENMGEIPVTWLGKSYYLNESWVAECHLELLPERERDMVQDLSDSNAPMSLDEARLAAQDTYKGTPH